MGARFVQEVAEVEQGVSRRQELQESLQEDKQRKFKHERNNSFWTFCV